MKRQQNTPNWVADILYYPSEGFAGPLELSIEQVWDGTANGHERLVSDCVETVEGWRDRLGGQYHCFWGGRHKCGDLKAGASGVTVIE